MHRPARTAGICSTIYIDDRFGAHLDRDTHKFETRMHCALMAGLGWFLSIHKCVFLPLQLVRFLGYYIDSLRGRFTLPEEKVNYTLSQIALALDAPEADRLGLHPGHAMACSLTACARPSGDLAEVPQGG